MVDQLALHGGTPVRTRPWPDWPEHGRPEHEALLRVLASRNWGGFPSPNTEARAFSEAFAAYLGTRSAVPCANGTVSLALALQAARISPGAEVVTSVYTFVGTAGGILAADCVPVFVDVLPESYCLDPDQVEAAIGPRTEAVLPVHLASSMADMDRLPKICEAHRLLLLEDCAHAHGMQWRGRSAGSIGHLGSFSMQSSKLLTAGEGGAVTTSDEAFARRLRALVNCGRIEPDDRTTEPMLGHNLRMTEWQAALLRAQLERVPEQHERRALRAEQFREALAAVPGVRVLPRDPRITRFTCYQLIVRYDAADFAGASRDAVIDALRAEGIPCSGRFYEPLPRDPLFARDPHTNRAVRAGVDYDAREFPVAARAAYQESIWLPHPLFLGSESDVEDLVAAFAKVQAGASALRGRVSTPTRFR
jgi:dTDP-4-amino-4,6-dideoxygalactose transaminase